MTPATAITPGKAWQVELAEAMFGARSAVGPFCSEHMPLITDALIRANQKFGNDLDRTDFLVLALATIGAENASLKPQDEGVQYKGPANNSAYELRRSIRIGTRCEFRKVGCRPPTTLTSATERGTRAEVGFN